VSVSDRHGNCSEALLSRICEITTRPVNDSQVLIFLETDGMPTSQARVQTTEASRYLQQLCRHWSHKFKVQATPVHGTVPFGDAEPDALVMRIDSADPVNLTRLENVVADHLARFAFRESLGDIRWSRAA
jgi:uncharacterized protein